MTSCREKLLRGLIACVGAVVIAFSCQAQAPAAPFQNLDFESAVIGTPVNFELPASQALPDWTNDHFHTGYVAYDTVAVGSVAISVQDSRTPYGSGPYLYPLQGQYSVMLQNGYGAGGIQDAWISQTGDVPSTGAH